MTPTNYSGTIEKCTVFYYIEGQNMSLLNFVISTSSPFASYPSIQSTHNWILNTI